MDLDLSKLTISHGPAGGADEWTDSLRKHSEAQGAALSKTLVFKPKTAKSAVPVPVVVIALQATATPSGVVAKAAGVKDPRMASADLIAEFFGGVVPEDLGLKAFTKDNADKIKVIVDSKLLTEAKVAIHYSSRSDTVVLSGPQLAAYLKAVGVDYVEQDFGVSASQAAPAGAPTSSPAPKKEEFSSKIEGAALIGITADKDLDFPGWYQQVLTKGEMLEYYDVSGCYILLPASYSIWEHVQDFFNVRIKSLGVKNASFPMFIPQKFLEREKDHIEGFAPEVAWVTRAGSTDLEEPIAIRPTSETVMYPYYAKWIRSHRDLPLKLNQWNSVVRWEFKHPQPFLRNREYLWQEGHTAHLTQAEAETETKQILDYYADVYKDLLAVPVVKGRKTEKEKFAGSFFSLTVEGYIPTTGRGIQGGTSHCLGQNFSKMFNIVVENPDGPDKPKIFVWQNSWGLSTRVIGVMVMVHSDNKGLVLPPAVAEYQTVVIPCGLTVKTTAEEKDAVVNGSKDIDQRLLAAGVRSTGDYRENYSPGWKFSNWELRGVPLRLEFGPADLKKNQCMAVRRDNGEKVAIPLADLETAVPALLKKVHSDMYERAKKNLDAHRVMVSSLDEFVPLLNSKNLVLAPFCGDEDCEDDIKERTSKPAPGEVVDERAPSMGAKSLCIPFDQPPVAEGTKCVCCGKPAKFITQFGRSY